MDLKDLEGLKDNIGELMKNVKEEDIDKIKELVKDGVDTDKIKDTLGKLDGLKGLFGGKKD